jgi:hypothetical protein
VRITGSMSGRTQVTEPVEIPEGQVLEKDFVLPSCRIIGSVVDGSGTPVIGASVTVATQPYSMDPALYPGSSSFSAASGAGGKFVLDSPALRPDQYTVAAAKEGMGAASATVLAVEGDSAPVVLTLRKQGGILVSTALNMSTGGPLPVAWLRITGKVGPYPVAAARDGNGVARVEGMPAGKYDISVGASGFSTGEHSVEIREGESASIEDVLYEAGSIRWIMLDAKRFPVKDVLCHVVASDPSSTEATRDARTDSNGAILLNGLLPGTYTGTAQLAGKPPLTATFNVQAHEVAHRVDTIAE